MSRGAGNGKTQMTNGRTDENLDGRLISPQESTSHRVRRDRGDARHEGKDRGKIACIGCGSRVAKLLGGYPLCAK